MELACIAITCICFFAAAYSDYLTGEADPALSIFSLIIWTFMSRNNPDHYLVSLLMLAVSCLFVWLMDLGGADCLWLAVITLVYGASGIMISIMAVVGYVVTMIMLKRQQERMPLIPYLAGSFIIYSLTGVIGGMFFYAN